MESREIRWFILENVLTLVLAVGLSVFLVWYTKSLWGLSGLLLLFNINKFKSESDNRCPKCGKDLSADDDERE